MNFLTGFSFASSGLRSHNRVALAPMTNQQSHEDGRASDEEIHWLASRAQGGFGMTITCAAHVHIHGQGWPREMGIFDDSLLPGLKRVASAISEAGSLPIVQLYHGGARSPQVLSGQQPVSASAWPVGPGAPDGTRELDPVEIQDLVQAFANAAERAWQAGFAGAELHGAHGYLITQFLDTNFNRRSDLYGGNLENRSRFLREIIAAVRSKVPKSFLLAVRLSPESAAPSRSLLLQDTLELCDLLIAEGGLDFVHMSLGQFDKFSETWPEPNQLLIKLLADHLGGRLPMMVAGGIVTPQDAAKAMDLGADLIALGRIAIGNPNWPIQAASGDFMPQRWPYSEQHLRRSHLSDAFIQYMKRWPGFVES